MSDTCDVTSALIDLALREDVGENLQTGDVTSAYFVPHESMTSAYIYAKENGVLAGLAVATEVFRRVDSDLEVRLLKEDGEPISNGDRVLDVSGRARSILTAERTALNFLQRLSGVATQTQAYASRIASTHAKVLDTRKTTPGWRALEKMAVLAGGGCNHRMGLYDRAMVKDNHLVAENKLDALQEAIDRVRAERGVEVELEADTLEQVESFLSLSGVDYILLDNMTNEMMRAAVAMRNDSGVRVALEASGGINLETIAGVATTGVDFISVGALTHSAVALDLSLEFE
ncbi:MAG: carboxylating nicotinate-nucleotide diphosphorylase [Akkermansiaceae bacterium]